MQKRSSRPRACCRCGSGHSRICMAGAGRGQACCRTAVFGDFFHPKHFVLASDQALWALIAMWRQWLACGSTPTQFWIVIGLLAKREGGDRPSGILATCIRILYRWLRRTYGNDRLHAPAGVCVRVARTIGRLCCEAALLPCRDRASTFSRLTTLSTLCRQGQAHQECAGVRILPRAAAAPSAAARPHQDRRL